jgi:hypothetical protein
MFICALKLCFTVTATGVFTPNSIRRDAAALWNEIPEPIQKDYTKEYFDRFIYNMIKYSTCGVSYTAEPLILHPCISHFPLFYALFKWSWANVSNMNVSPILLACWPLVPKFVGSNPAEVGFFWRKNPQHAFLQRGSKAICPMS